MADASLLARLRGTHRLGLYGTADLSRLDTLRGQEDREACTVACRVRAALHADAAAVFLGDLLHQPQPESGTGFLPGREEGLEEQLDVLRLDAGPIVLDGDRYALLALLLSGMGLYLQRASLA